MNRTIQQATNKRFELKRAKRRKRAMKRWTFLDRIRSDAALDRWLDFNALRTFGSHKARRDANLTP